MAVVEGIGRIQNITFTNMSLGNAQQMFQISSCPGRFGSGPACDSSIFSVSDVEFTMLTGV